MLRLDEENAEKQVNLTMLEIKKISRPPWYVVAAFALSLSIRIFPQLVLESIYIYRVVDGTAIFAVASNVVALIIAMRVLGEHVYSLHPFLLVIGVIGILSALVNWLAYILEVQVFMGMEHELSVGMLVLCVLQVVVLLPAQYIICRRDLVSHTNAIEADNRKKWTPKLEGENFEDDEDENEENAEKTVEEIDEDDNLAWLYHPIFLLAKHNGLSVVTFGVQLLLKSVAFCVVYGMFLHLYPENRACEFGLVFLVLSILLEIAVLGVWAHLQGILLLVTLVYVFVLNIVSWISVAVAVVPYGNELEVGLSIAAATVGLVIITPSLSYATYRYRNLYKIICYN